MIDPTQARSAGNRSEPEGGQTHRPEQIKHELADLSSSQANVKDVGPGIISLTAVVIIQAYD